MYIPKKNDFAKIPKLLLDNFGPPILSLIFDFNKKNLVNADKELVKKAIETQGYYLQLPPKEENLLDEFKKANNFEN